MFRRRDPHRLRDRLSTYFWPRGGWRRQATYLSHRVRRLPGSAYSLAAGFAFGAAVSFTPLIGLHFFLAGLLAWLFRANIVAAIIGTAIGNPWTFPFIWVTIYEIGAWILGGSVPDVRDVDFFAVFLDMMRASLGLDFGHLFDAIWPVWRPMLVGGVPTALLVWLLFYIVLRRSIEAYRAVRARRRARRHERSKRARRSPKKPAPAAQSETKP